MEELTLTTPALLFSAVSLILLAYTNRFLSYAQLVRQLRDRYVENPSDITEAQIENLRKRLNLTRTMQGLGAAEEKTLSDTAQAALTNTLTKFML